MAAESSDFKMPTPAESKRRYKLYKKHWHKQEKKQRYKDTKPRKRGDANPIMTYADIHKQMQESDAGMVLWHFSDEVPVVIIYRDSFYEHTTEEQRSGRTPPTLNDMLHFFSRQPAGSLEAINRLAGEPDTARARYLHRMVQSENQMVRVHREMEKINSETLEIVKQALEEMKEDDWPSVKEIVAMETDEEEIAYELELEDGVLIFPVRMITSGRIRLSEQMKKGTKTLEDTAKVLVAGGTIYSMEMYHERKANNPNGYNKMDEVLTAKIAQAAGNAGVSMEEVIFYMKERRKIEEPGSLGCIIA